MLQNKNGIIFGVANKRSIAWATAQALHEAGAHLAFTYQGERLKENVESLTNESMPGSLLLSWDEPIQRFVEEGGGLFVGLGDRVQPRRAQQIPAHVGVGAFLERIDDDVPRIRPNPTTAVVGFWFPKPIDGFPQFG